MPKQSLPKSLVSAYFDGEVTAEERAAVSRAAQQSPAVQQMLDDYAQLSQSLKSLHSGIPSPRLREAVLSEIQPSAKPRVSPVPALLHRRWVPLTAAIVTVAAAGLLMMFNFAGPQPNGAAELAMHEAAERAESDAETRREARPPPAGDALAMRTVPSPPESTGSDPTSETTETSQPASDTDSDLIHTASVPEEWFTQQVAKDRRTPRPGDVMNYILREADRTVLIPVTVVDVQMTAGRFRLLLAKHGIQSLPMKESAEADATDDSAVAILVESDWDRFSAVMNDLDTEGFGVVTFFESSRAAQRAMREQNAGAAESLSKAAAPRSSSAADAPAPPAESAIVENAPREDAAALAEDQTAGPSGMFLESPVTDEFLEQLDERQQADEDDASAAALADSASSARQPETGEAAQRDGAPANPRFWERPFASHAPARVVFVIKKSGTAP